MSIYHISMVVKDPSAETTGNGKSFPGSSLGEWQGWSSDVDSVCRKYTFTLLPDNCSLRLIPLQRPSTKASYLLLVVLYIMKMLMVWVVMVKFHQSMNSLGSSGHVPVCLSSSQSVPCCLSQVKAQPCLM